MYCDRDATWLIDVNMELKFKRQDNFTYSTFIVEFNKFIEENGVPTKMVFDYTLAPYVCTFLGDGKYNHMTGIGHWFGIKYIFDLVP